MVVSLSIPVVASARIPALQASTSHTAGSPGISRQAAETALPWFSKLVSIFLSILAVRENFILLQEHLGCPARAAAKLVSALLNSHRMRGVQQFDSLADGYR